MEIEEIINRSQKSLWAQPRYCGSSEGVFLEWIHAGAVPDTTRKMIPMTMMSSEKIEKKRSLDGFLEANWNAFWKKVPMANM